MNSASSLDELTIGVIGAGAMGRGIAWVAALAGFRVLLFDERAETAQEALGFIAEGLERLVGKGKLATERAASAVGNIVRVEQLAGLQPCGLVIEAVVENLEVKQNLFRALEQVVADDCVLASNTSSLSVSAIAALCRLPGRIAGFHFFMPVPVMKVVEVIGGVQTEPATTRLLFEVAGRMEMRPVGAQDTPGFIVNHAGRGLGTEAMRILDENVADIATIDAVLKQACGFRMGPFELMDFVGLDISHAVMNAVYMQYFQEPRFRPSPALTVRAAAGLLGRKSGRGFYDYVDGRITPAAAPEAATGALPASVFVAAGMAVVRISAIVVAAGVPIAGTAESAALIVVPVVGEDTTTAAVRLGLDPAKCVGIDAVFGLDSHRVLMSTPATTGQAKASAARLFSGDGVSVSSIQDSPGAIAQRVVAMIVNIACGIAERGIATPADIDQAVTLALGYPMGPFAWGDSIGAATILHILETLQALTGDPRYRPSLWLRRRAVLGLSLTTSGDLHA